MDPADIIIIGFIGFMCGELLYEIPTLIRLKYIGKHIAERHDSYAKSKWMMTRKICTYYGYNLETLQYDKKWKVRIEVAHRGYNLNHFLNDENTLVRKEAERLLRKK